MSFYQGIMPAQVPKTQELGRFAASFRRLRPEKSSASGWLRPLAPTRGSTCPWTPLGALPPDPRYRFALRARHGLAPSNENLCVRPCLSHSFAVLKTTERIKLPFRVRVTPKHCDIIVLRGSPDPPKIGVRDTSPKFTKRALSQSHLAVYISGIV